jgi:hypothetical protein
VTPEQEIWAVALWVEKHHGSDGPRYIADQIGRRAIAGDDAGIKTWVAIARAFDQLMLRKDVLSASPIPQ